MTCSINFHLTTHALLTLLALQLHLPGGAPQGGQGGGRPPPPNLSIGGGIAPPPQLGLQYKGVPKSPLLSLFCNSVYWLKPHNNVNSRPPKLAVLPPPCLPPVSCLIGAKRLAIWACKVVGAPVDRPDLCSE